MNRAVYSNNANRKLKLVFPALLVFLAVATFLWTKEGRPGRSPATDKTQVAQVLGKRAVTGSQVQDGELTIQYSIDSNLQQTIEQVYKKGKVPYGAFVAMDPHTGQVLAMVSHGIKDENIALRSTFPAASIFKIITAAAAIDNGKLQRESMIPVRGSFHTLYKQNVLKGGGIDPASTPRYARLISFEDALAKSVNSVFGKVGIFGVGPDGLRKQAQRFQFGKPIPFELAVETDQALIPDDEFGVAEAASGYTRNNTLSPLHGAMIAAAVANGGIMMEPSIVSKVSSKDGKIDYAFTPKPLATVLEKPKAEELAMMMHQTIVNGTSRRAFSSVDRSIALNEAFIAGKTGTLNGWSPPGRYDWFVGFAERDGRKIAVAALCIHGARHGVKASQVARVAFEKFYGSTIAVDTLITPMRSSRHHGRRHHRPAKRPPVQAAEA